MPYFDWSMSGGELVGSPSGDNRSGNRSDASEDGNGMAITEATRGHIRVQRGERTITVWGEMLAKSPGLPDYQIYSDLIKSWDTPHDAELLTPDEIESVLAEVCAFLRSQDRTPVVLTG